ncbi:MAG: GNAT family N-acetyltransferase [bacterium]
MRIIKYTEDDKAKWDEFVKGAKNTHFMFFRDYMDYHRDRFVDHSLLIYNDASEIIALLPANLIERTLVSHSGLTFGGFIMDHRMKTPRMMKIFEAVIKLLKDINIEEWIYKTIPSIYHTVPAEEDRFCLSCHSAKLIRRDVLSVVDPGHQIEFQQRRIRGIKKAIRNGLKVKQTNDFGQFWKVLEQNLLTRYKVKPVHNLSEIILLADRFLDNIKLFACCKDNEIVAGVVTYETNKVVHAQYIASNEIGKAYGALDLVFQYLIKQSAQKRKYFDFGISNEQDTSLNIGLNEFKESFGARTVVHDHYLLQIPPQGDRYERPSNRSLTKKLPYLRIDELNESRFVRWKKE